MKTKIFIFFIIIALLFVIISCGSRYGDKRDAGVKIQIDSALRKSLALNKSLVGSAADEDYYLTVVIYEIGLLNEQSGGEINQVSSLQVGSVLYEQFTTTDKIIKYKTQPIYWDNYVEIIDFLDINAEKNYIVEAAITLGQPYEYMTGRYQVTDPIAYGANPVFKYNTSNAYTFITLSEAVLQYQKTRSIEGYVPYVSNYEINNMYGADDFEVSPEVLAEFEFDTKSIVALSHDGLRLSKQITSSDTYFKFDLPVNKYYSLTVLLENDEYEFNVPLMALFGRESLDLNGSLESDTDATVINTLFYLSDGSAINLGSFRFIDLYDNLESVYNFNNSIFEFVDRDGDGITDYEDTNPYNINYNYYEFNPELNNTYGFLIRFSTSEYIYSQISRMFQFLMASNPKQDDLDGDGINNFIDIDIDGDGVPNFLDNDILGRGVSDTVTTVIDIAKKFFYNGEISEAARLFSRAYNMVGGYKDSMALAPSYTSTPTSTEKAEIGFYLALSRIWFFLESGQSSIALSEDAGLYNTKRLLDGLGFSADNRKLLDFDLDDPSIIENEYPYNDYFQFKTDKIDQNNLQKEYVMYLVKELIMAVEYLEYASNYNVNIEISYSDIYNLREAAGDYSEQFGIYDKIIVDEGDLSLLKSFISFDLFSIYYTLLSGNLDIADNENLLEIINDIDYSDTYDMEAFLNANPDFLKPRSDFEYFGFETFLSELSSDFSNLLLYHQFARMFLESALEYYSEASDYIRNIRNIESANNLISFMDETDTPGLDEIFNEVQFRNIVDSALYSLENYVPVEISEDGENITIDFNRFFDLPNGLRDFIPAMNKDDVVEQGAYDYSKFAGQGKLLPDWTPERLRLAAGDIEEELIMTNAVDFIMEYHQPKDLYYSVVVTDTQVLYGELEAGEWSFYEIESGEYTGVFEMMKVFQFQHFKLFLREAGEMHYQLSYSLAGTNWSEEPFTFDFDPNEMIVSDININEDNSLTLLIDTRDGFEDEVYEEGFYYIDIPYNFNPLTTSLETLSPQLLLVKDESMAHENFNLASNEFKTRVRKTSQNQIVIILETMEHIDGTGSPNKYYTFLLTSDGQGGGEMTEVINIESADMFKNLLTRFNSSNELVYYYAVIDGDISYGFDEADIKIYEKIGDNEPTQLFRTSKLLTDIYYDGQNYYGIAIGKTASDTGIFYIYKDGSQWNIELMKSFKYEYELYHITEGGSTKPIPFSAFDIQKIQKTPDNNTVYAVFGERLYYKYQTSNWAKQYIPFWAEYVPNKIFIDNNLLIKGSFLIFDHYQGGYLKNLYLSY